MSFPIAFELTEFKRKTLNLFGIVYSDINNSFSHQKELLNLISEITLRENISYEVLLNEIIFLLKNELNEFDKNFKLNLNKRKFPFITDFKKK